MRDPADLAAVMAHTLVTIRHSTDLLGECLTEFLDKESWRSFFSKPLNRVVDYATFREFCEDTTIRGLGIPPDRLLALFQHDAALHATIAAALAE